MRRLAFVLLAVPVCAASNWARFAEPLPEVTVTTHDGRQTAFATLLKDRLVAINFIFTSCQAVCPLQAAAFAKVQRELGARAGRDVHLISISVDPAHDTPEALRRFGSRYGAQLDAGRGWTFVTGEPRTIARLLNALQGGAGERSAHSRGVIVYSGAAQRWSWTQESNSAASIQALLEEGARLRP